jgi:EmrB/QacA subfamily drug resistance transporter
MVGEPNARISRVGRRPQGCAFVKRSVPLILAVALFMEQMDSTVISTSLPAIAVDIGTSPIALKLALTAYFVSLAIFIPISGWMADRFGAKRLFRIAIGVFVVGSICCAGASSLGEFVAARFLQGMGGAMMTPVARLVLVRATPKAQLISAMAWLTIPALIGPLIGPPVGGFITTFFSWHWIFLINVPIGIAGIIVAGRVLPEVPGEPVGRLDIAGFLIAAVAASGVVFGLSVVSLPALPPIVGIVTLVVGVVACVAYVRHARVAPLPILDLRLFDNPVPRIAISSGAIFRIGVGAIPFLLPLMFQIGFGLSPFEAGMLTFASALGAIAMKFVATKMLRSFGFRLVLLGAVAVGAVLMGVNAFFTPQTPYAVIIAVLIAAGLFRSLFFTSNNALVFSDIEDRQAAQATAIAAVSQQVSIALGVAVAGLILEAHHLITGEELGIAAFSTAFIVISAIALMAVIPLLSLKPDAGEQVSGHLKAQAARTPPPDSSV